MVCHISCACRVRLKCDGTRTETRIRLSAKRTSPFKSAGASVQWTTGSRGVRISGSNAGYTVFRGSVKGFGNPLNSPFSPFTSPPAHHRVPSHFDWTLPTHKMHTNNSLPNLPLCEGSTVFQPCRLYLDPSRRDKFKAL